MSRFFSFLGVGGSPKSGTSHYSFWAFLGFMLHVDAGDAQTNTLLWMSNDSMIHAAVVAVEYQHQYNPAGSCGNHPKIGSSGQPKNKVMLRHQLVGNNNNNSRNFLHVAYCVWFPHPFFMISCLNLASNHPGISRHLASVQVMYPPGCPQAVLAAVLASFKEVTVAAITSVQDRMQSFSSTNGNHAQLLKSYGFKEYPLSLLHNVVLYTEVIRILEMYTCHDVNLFIYTVLRYIYVV